MEQESAEEAETSSDDDKLQDLPPCWGLDIVCGKGTDFNYGPWADRQRCGKCHFLDHFFLDPGLQCNHDNKLHVPPGKHRI